MKPKNNQIRFMNKVSMSLKDREAKRRKTSETFEAKGKITKPIGASTPAF
jgi:hypothetical protein